MAARQGRPAKRTSFAPATTPTERENQVINLAMDLAEKQIREGSASAQVVSHFLKLGSERENLEKERLAAEVTMLRAKVEALSSAKRVESLYEDAIRAFRQYSGQDPVEADYGTDSDLY